MNNEKIAYLFITFSPNNVFFNLAQFENKFRNETSPFFLNSLLTYSCGLYKEKGIKRTTMVAFEKNFKNFIDKIKIKKIFFNTLCVIFNYSTLKFRRNKFENFFSLKKYLVLMFKYLKFDTTRVLLINNQKFSFNGCRLPKYQRKKIRRKNLFWLNFTS